MNQWDLRGEDYISRIQQGKRFADGKIIQAKNIVPLLESVIKSGDKICIEGDNQKQADFLAKALCKIDAQKVNHLHMIQSTIALPEHLDVFEKGIASKIDFAYSGPQSKRLAKMIQDGTVKVGAIHTYMELYGRYYVDLTPRVALVVGLQADKNGNLFTGGSTEDTPAIIEAVKARKGIVIAQVNKIVDKLPRIDFSGDWVDFIVESPSPFTLEPLFTRDPAKISNKRILKAMMALQLYKEYNIKTLNHGIGYDTAAIELLLPTYGEELGLKGKICQNFVLNPHPTMIPAIEAGWVKSIHSPGSEVGMEEYVKSRPDVFFVDPSGEMRSSRVFTQIAGQYAIDLFIGSTLQIDKYGNSSTATKTSVAGFGGAPNIGSDAHGRRHASYAWTQCGDENTGKNKLIGPVPRGQKLVVQVIDTVSAKGFPGFVEELDAMELAKKVNLEVPPIMIYGDDLTHIITEKGVAYLNKCSSLEERMAAIRSIAGDSPVGQMEKKEETMQLRARGIVRTPKDMGCDVNRATSDLLAAHSIKELMEISGGLYQPPQKFL